MHKQRARDHRDQPPDKIHMQAHSAATEAVKFSGPRQTEIVQYSAAKLSITGARYSAAVVKRLHLLCRGAPVTEAAAEAVQFSAVSLAKAGAQSSVASLAKAGAQSNEVVVKRRAETVVAEAVHHEEDKFTTVDFR